MAQAMFAAGCFWGVETAFRAVPGVTGTTVGYSGGSTANPNYQDVCTGRTGHAEVTLVDFDPAVVSYDRLLELFWEAHDPTSLNRQGPDSGTQYRSAIFYLTPEQGTAARRSRDVFQASGNVRQPIVTEITAAGPFYRAEEYHQQYLEKRGLATCHIPNALE